MYYAGESINLKMCGISKNFQVVYSYETEEQQDLEIYIEEIMTPDGHDIMEIVCEDEITRLEEIIKKAQETQIAQDALGYLLDDQERRLSMFQERAFSNA